MTNNTERNWVGEIALECFFQENNPHIRLTIDEVGSTLLTMDQIDSLAAILRKWVEQYQQDESARYMSRLKKR